MNEWQTVQTMIMIRCHIVSDLSLTCLLRPDDNDDVLHAFQHHLSHIEMVEVVIIKGSVQ